MSTYTIWPERRWLSHDEIADLYVEAVADGTIVPDSGKATESYMAMALEFVGIIIVGEVGSTNFEGGPI